MKQGLHKDRFIFTINFFDGIGHTFLNRVCTMDLNKLTLLQNQKQGNLKTK